MDSDRMTARQQDEESARLRRLRQQDDDQAVPEGGAYSVRTYELGRLEAQLTPAERICADVLTTALEGGIGYWSQAARMVRAADGSHVAVVLHPEEPGDFEPKRVELADVLRALELAATGDVRYVSERVERTARALLTYSKLAYAAGADDQAPDYDAGDADAIVQVAAFGEVVYG